MQGISFRFMYDLWLKMSSTFSLLADFFTLRLNVISADLSSKGFLGTVASSCLDFIISLFGNLSIIEIMFSSGITAYLVYVLIKAFLTFK